VIPLGSWRAIRRTKWEIALSLSLPADLVEPFVGGLLGGIDVSDGPTQEQLKVLKALVREVWNRPDIDLMNLRRLSADQLLPHLAEPNQRELFHELHLTLEACRHPQTKEQVDAVQFYATALDVVSEDLAIFRDLVEQGIQEAADDYARFLRTNLDERTEPSLINLPVDEFHPELELANKLEAFAEYGPKTLGQAYIGFYKRFQISLPGTELSALNHFFLAHDMTHTIAGISTTVAGEVALSAFQFAMNNNRINRAAFLASLVAHEAGFAHPDHLRQADAAVLSNDDAVLLLGQELKRGGYCTGDFSLVDHFELAPMRLADVRAEFGVRAPQNRNDGHHFLW